MYSAYPFVEEPYDHQLTYLERHGRDKYHALFEEMGTGKTKQIIDNASILYDEGKIVGLLVLALNGVHTNWIRTEIPKHLPEHLREHTLVLEWKGYVLKKDRIARQKFLEPTDKFRILAVNIEALSKKTNQAVEYIKQFLRATNKQLMMVLDESSTIKSHKATRSKVAVNMAQLVPYRRILTGTPITQSPFDAYMQTEFLEKGLLGFRNYHTFSRHYGVFERKMFGQRGFDAVVGYQHLDELRQKLGEFSTFIRKDECIDLPPKVYETRYVHLTDDQRDAYNDMRHKLRVELDAGDVSVMNALTKLIRLHNIVLGYLPLDDGRIVRIPSARIEALKSVLNEMTGKVIIWCNYVPAIHELIEHIDTAVVYYGEISQEGRAEAVHAFQNDPQVKYFIANQATAGYGLTLTAASNVVYYHNGYSLEQRLQSEDRCHRIGQKKTVTYVDLIAPNTVDEHVANALMDKLDVASQVVDVMTTRNWFADAYQT